jgi:hypothetical protein
LDVPVILLGLAEQFAFGKSVDAELLYGKDI